jgi:hypothetical protein
MGLIKDRIGLAGTGLAGEHGTGSQAIAAVRNWQGMAGMDRTGAAWMGVVRKEAAWLGSIGTERIDQDEEGVSAEWIGLAGADGNGANR